MHVVMHVFWKSFHISTKETAFLFFCDCVVLLLLPDDEHLLELF